MQFSRTWKVLGKERYFKVAVEMFWILFGRSPNYSGMDTTLCRIKHCISCVRSFYYL